MANYIKSPIHYMGNKYDLLPYLIEQFPKPEEVTTFYDLFGGSGTVSLNVPYKNVVYNELNENMVNLLKMIKDTDPQEIIDHINKRIKEFGLNEEGTDIRQNVEGIEELRNYYSNKYFEFRKFYNESEKDIKDLYALSFYSFCNLMRFNSKNEFNMPFGNRCFIKEDAYRLIEAHNRFIEKNIDLRQGDTFELMASITNNENQFLYCFDKNTEVLTNNGWKFFKDIDINNDLFLSREPNTNKLEYKKAINFINYKYEGKMFHYLSREIDLCTTMNHKLFIEKRHENRKGEKWNTDEFITAEELYNGSETNRYFINAGGIWEGIKDDTIEICGQIFDKKKFARFLGIFLTDGSVNIKGIIAITQKKENVIKIIDELINDLKIKCSRHNYNNTICWYISRKYLSFFEQFYLKDNRHIPNEFKNAKPEILKELIEGILDGDAWSERRRLAFSSKPLRDDLMEICYKAGYSSCYKILKNKSQWYEKEKRYITSKKELYGISIKHYRGLTYVKNNVRIEDYNDMVYCVTLEDWHTVLVRRNGKSIWCGQCDPPYQNSTAIYNENRALGGWGIEDDEKLFSELDRLTKLGIKWAYSNVLSIKGKDNDHIEAWANRNGYTIIELENKEYSSLGKGNANAREVLIINYEQRAKRYSIFDFLDE